jgi:hypothetical protein
MWSSQFAAEESDIDRDMCNSESDVHVRPAAVTPLRRPETPEMGIRSFIRMLFGADTPAPLDPVKLDGTTGATLVRSLSALPADERGWVTFAEARVLFSTKGAQYAFGETDRDGRKNIESFAAQHRSVISFMPVEGRVYFVRDPTAVTMAPDGHRSHSDQ